jgi:D-alanyl-D-alanine carboxypeptidase
LCKFVYKFYEVTEMAKRNGCSIFVLAALSIALSTLLVSGCSTGVSGWKSFSEAVAATREALGTPAISAAVFDDRSIIEHVTVGTLSATMETAVGNDAKWHIGSCTKAMTSALVGRLADSGVIGFSTTIGEVYSAESIDPLFSPVTLSDLLRHHGGVTGALYKSHPELWQELWLRASEDQPALRRSTALSILEGPPNQKPGKYTYSNAGVIIAGAMMEETAAESWETLMYQELFGPLDMASAGFGAAGKDEPWPHRWEAGTLVPVDPDQAGSDNPPGLGPAGTVHVSLPDWIKFLQVFIGGGPDGFLSSTAQQELLRTETKDAAAGWFVAQREWADGLALSHDGSNTMNYAKVWLAPEKRIGLAIATNSAGPKTNVLLSKLADWIIRTYIAAR